MFLKYLPLQELNKCKTELQYWRSKSPAIPTCISCGQKVTPVLPAEDYQALVNQGVKPEDILNLNDDTDTESDVSMNDSGCNNLSLSNEFVFPDETTTAKLLAVNTASKNLKRQHHLVAANNTCNISTGPTTAFVVSHTNLNNNETTELTDFIDCNDASTSSSAFIAAAGYSTRLFYGSSPSLRTLLTSTPTSVQPSNNSATGGQIAQHKSVIVSPQSQRLVNMETSKIVENVTTNGSAEKVIESVDTVVLTETSASGDNINGFSNDQDRAVMANTEDVNSLMAISSHETKKARRVQKTARCLNGSSGKRK